MIVTLTGPSGVGKTTLLHHLVRALKDAQPLMSYTTRAPRPTDEPGEYAYVSEEEFERRLAAGEFLWEAHTYKNKYGTRKEEVNQALKAGLYIPILVMDAAKKLYAYAPKGTARFLYVRIDDEDELRTRFKERGDNPEETEARIAECRGWNEEAVQSGVPFVYLDGKKPREELLQEALAALR